MVDTIMSGHISDRMLRMKKRLRLTSIMVTHDLYLMYKVTDQMVSCLGAGDLLWAAGGSYEVGSSVSGILKFCQRAAAQ